MILHLGYFDTFFTTQVGVLKCPHLYRYKAQLMAFDIGIPSTSQYTGVYYEKKQRHPEGQNY